METHLTNMPTETLDEKNEDDVAVPPEFSDSSSSIDERPAENPDEKPNDLQSAVSRSRSTTSNNPRFSHPLAKSRTSPDTIVDFDGPTDPYLPMNWPFHKKALITICYGLSTMGSTWASSIYSTSTLSIVKEFHISHEVAALGLALFLMGFGTGPMLWAPLSEVYGRKITVLPPYFLSAVFAFATATAKDVQTIFITRFFAGFFGSAPLTVTGGVLADLWPPQQRGNAMLAYSLTIIGGPLAAPVVGGAIVHSDLGWRWTEYITGILLSVICALDILFISETYPPVKLVHKAQRLRYTSGNWALHAKHEEWDVSLKELTEKFLIRPFALMLDPTCFFVSLYGSFVFGIIYLTFPAFPIVYQSGRGWNPVVGGLPFLSTLVGSLLGAPATLMSQDFYRKRLIANNNRPVPEARLLLMMIGAPFLAGGLFIFAWTSNPDIPWIGSVIGAACIGFGFFTIFPATMNYLVDTFTMYAASAVATFTFMRSIIAGAFALVALPLFHNLGVEWAASLLGFVALALIPIPFLYYIYGKKIRAKGKWSKASL